jgi:hypothetical protein
VGGSARSTRWSAEIEHFGLVKRVEDSIPYYLGFFVAYLLAIAWCLSSVSVVIRADSSINRFFNLCFVCHNVNLYL